MTRGGSNRRHTGPDIRQMPAGVCCVTQAAHTRLCDNPGGGMVREVGGMVKREGTWIYLWLIHVHGWQKSAQYCKAIILPLKRNKCNF